MTDEKRYRHCMAGIIAVLKRYDMAGAVTVVDKERAMFKYHFPTWTCVELGEDHVRLRMKASEHPSEEVVREIAELTAHVVMQMRDCAMNTIGLTEHLGKIMTERWGMEHTPFTDFDPEREH
jgi:hypothetical protein